MAGSCSVSSMLRDEATVIPAGPERRDAPVAVGWTKQMSPDFQKSDGNLKEAAARPGGINPKKDAIAASREAPHGDADTGAEGTDEGHLVNKRLRGEEQGLAGCLNQAPVSPSEVIPVQPPEVGHQLDGRDQGLKPKPIVALDAVPVRPCRSSARVSEKEKRESENAVKEQGLLSDQDSRESKERGRKEARSGARASKAIQSITLEELEKGVGHVGTVEGKGMVDGEHMVEEEKEKRTISHEGPSVLGGRLDAGKQAAWGEEATGPEKEKASTKSGAGDIAGQSWLVCSSGGLSIFAGDSIREICDKRCLANQHIPQRPMKQVCSVLGTLGQCSAERMYTIGGGDCFLTVVCSSLTVQVQFFLKDAKPGLGRECSCATQSRGKLITISCCRDWYECRQ
jgi:hypothetical protein